LTDANERRQAGRTSLRGATRFAGAFARGLRVLGRWSGPAAVAAVGAVMLCWSWAAWPDPIVDFGQQLYIPWRLAEGEVLYRDLAFYNGPLSQHVNALVFALFGTSLLTLVVWNLVLLVLLTVLLYHALGQVAGRFAAAAACLAFVLLFAFAQFVTIGNYNYVCPYSHEMTHGLLLSLAALACLWRYRRNGLPALVLGGLAVGLAFLTKAEVFLAGAVATTLALAMTIWAQRPPRRRALQMAGSFVGAALVPPIAALALLSLAMSPHEALAGTAGSWVVAASERLRHLRFFRAGMGVLDLWGNLTIVLRWVGWYAAVLVPAAVVAVAVRRHRKTATGVACGAFAAVAAILWLVRGQIDWRHVARPLPLLVAAAAVAFFVQLLRRRRDSARSAALIRRITLAVFALTLLSKMILNARIYHYGFVLAMPAALVTIVAFLDWSPAAIRRFGGSGRVFCAAALAMLLAVVVRYLDAQRYAFEAKTERVMHRSADAFKADRRGAMINSAIRTIRARLPAGGTMAVLPEGVMLNYLCRLRNPTPYTNFMPPEVFLFGEEAILRAFETDAPDIVVLAHKDTSEFGYQFFGTDYAWQIYDWIMQNYRPVGPPLGAPPLRGHHFGIEIRIRSDLAAAR
jgi:hypothetical protein